MPIWFIFIFFTIIVFSFKYLRILSSVKIQQFTMFCIVLIFNFYELCLNNKNQFLQFLHEKLSFISAFTTDFCNAILLFMVLFVLRLQGWNPGTFTEKT